MKSWTNTYWDTLVTNEEERRLLARLRRTKVGDMAETDYATAGCEGYWSPDDDFSEIINRVDYMVELQEEYWQDGWEWEAKITRANIQTAKRWLKDARAYYRKQYGRRA